MVHVTDAFRPFRVRVVGGGPAGWLTALALVEWRPELEVEVVTPPASPVSGRLAIGPEGVAFLHGYLAIPPVVFDRAVGPAWSLGTRRDDGVHTFAAGNVAEALRYDGHLGRSSLAAQLMVADRLPIARVGGTTISLLRETPFGYEVDRARFVEFLRERALRNGARGVDGQVTEGRFDLCVDASEGGDPVAGAYGPLAGEVRTVVTQIAALLEGLEGGRVGHLVAPTTFVDPWPDVAGEPELTAAEWEALVTMRATVVHHALPPAEAIAAAHADPTIFAGLLHDEASWCRALVADLQRRAPSRGRASDALEQWAREQSVSVIGPAELAKIPDEFPISPASDFGRFLRKTPPFLLRPRDQRELADALRMLTRRRIPFKVRAGGHSSGGQSLTDDGAVIDVTELKRVVSDSPSEELVRVEAGMMWLDLVRHLKATGRGPRVLTGNLRSTVGGTLTVGGFGESSHLDGPQIDIVRGLTVMTLDGESHAVGPGDELFDWSLAGRGQLGIVTEALLETKRQPYDMRVRLLEWNDLDGFFVGARRILAERRFDFLKGRVQWGKRAVVSAPAGHFADARPSAVDDFHGLGAAISVAAPFDFFAASVAASTEAVEACPAMEFAVPFDAVGQAAMIEIYHRIAELGLTRFMPRGAPLCPVPGGRYPLSPVPPVGGLVTAIRPEIPPAEVPQWLPALFALGERAIAAGGRYYLMSIEPEGDRSFLEGSLGKATVARWRELKARFDPQGLLNPGLL